MAVFRYLKGQKKGPHVIKSSLWTKAQEKFLVCVNSILVIQVLGLSCLLYGVFRSISFSKPVASLATTNGKESSFDFDLLCAVFATHGFSSYGS